MATVDLPTYHLWDQECSKIFLNQVQCARSHIDCPLFSWACLKNLGEESFALGSAFRNALEHRVLVWCGCCWYLEHCISFSENSLKSRRFTSAVFLEMLNSPDLFFFPVQSKLMYLYINSTKTCYGHPVCKALCWALGKRWCLNRMVPATCSCKAGTGHVGGRARGELTTAWGWKSAHPREGVAPDPC